MDNRIDCQTCEYWDNYCLLNASISRQDRREKSLKELQYILADVQSVRLESLIILIAPSVGGTIRMH